MKRKKRVKEERKKIKTKERKKKRDEQTNPTYELAVV